MTSTIQILVLLLSVVAAVAIVANRLRIPPSILLVVTGVLLALVPGLPPVELAPEVVLLLVLPPIIYTSAFQMSWREFRFNLRPIGLLSIGGVAFTTVVVAAAAHWLMDLPWAVGFVLGAIISEWRSRAASSSCSKARRSPTMRPRSSSTASPSPR
jgi:CPA1 family monovalent cation:H+ antiporter